MLSHLDGPFLTSFANAVSVTLWIQYPCWKWYTVCPLWYVSGFDTTLFWAVRLVGWADDAEHVLLGRDPTTETRVPTQHRRFWLQAKCFKQHWRWLVMQYHCVSSYRSWWQLSDETRFWALHRHGDQSTALVQCTAAICRESSGGTVFHSMRQQHRP